MIDIDQLRLILDLVREHELAEFELEQQGLRLKIRKDAVAWATPPNHLSTTPVASGPVATAAPAAANPTSPSADTSEDGGLAIVTSPIVGTFYQSPEPGAPPFADVGSSVKKGQVLCIIEAMKLMNEIDSEYDGDVVRVYVENGQPVQYGDRLFAIKVG